MNFAEIRARVDEDLAASEAVSEFVVAAHLLAAYAHIFGVAVGDLLAAEIHDA